MARRLAVFVAGLQLARVGLVLTAVSNIWVVVWLGRLGRGGETRFFSDIWGDLLPAGGVAVGMYTFGMVLNDLMDLRRDRLIFPDRPLPSRRIRPATATGLALTALLVSIACSGLLGSRSTQMCLLTAALVLFYNGPGKHIAGIGVVVLGLIRATHMLIGDPSLAYLWPVWLTMTHVIGLSAACHRLEEKRPPLTGAHLWFVTLGWAFVSLTMIGWMKDRGALALPGHPWVWLGPAVAGAAFLALAIATVRTGDSPRRAGGLLMKRGLIWLMVYDAAWLLGAGLWGPAALSAGLILATWVLMGAIRWSRKLTESRGAQAVLETLDPARPPH